MGRYKTTANHVKTRTGEVFRFAEPHDVPAKMQAWVARFNAVRSMSPEEALVEAALLHYDFVLIHPFDDGNGRMSRLLMNLALMQAGFVPAVIKTEDKENYFSGLQQADGEQTELFVEYIAKNVCDALRTMVAGARGEEIDDEAVLTRQKIRVLEQVFKSGGDYVTTTRSEEAIKTFAAQVLAAEGHLS